MLTNKRRIKKEKYREDPADELGAISRRVAAGARRDLQSILDIVEKTGKAELIAELDDGEEKEMIDMFNALKSVAQTLCPGLKVAEL